jgi:hypothetical protein
MRKISYVMAALATIAIAVPSIANAEEMKSGRMKQRMTDGGWTYRHHHHMYLSARPYDHHYMMKRDMMKNEM